MLSLPKNFFESHISKLWKRSLYPRQSPLVGLSRIIDAMAAMHWRNFHALKFGALGLVAKTFEFRVGFDANQLSWCMPNSVLYVLYDEFFYNTLCFKHLFIYVRDLGKSLCRIKKDKSPFQKLLLWILKWRFETLNKKILCSCTRFSVEYIFVTHLHVFANCTRTPYFNIRLHQ